MLFAATVTVNGNIENKGCSGWHRNYCHDAGGSGGGAGGSVYIKANEVQFGGSSGIDARGGNGLDSGAWCNQNAAGGAGAVGRIRVDYNLVSYGSPRPPHACKTRPAWPLTPPPAAQF